MKCFSGILRLNKSVKSELENKKKRRLQDVHRVEQYKEKIKVSRIVSFGKYQKAKRQCPQKIRRYFKMNMKQ